MTWEPWLSKAKETDFGHVILDSKDVPGVILDTLTVQDLLREYTVLVGMSGTIVAVADTEAEALSALGA